MSAFASNGLGSHGGTQAPHALEAAAPPQDASLRNWVHVAGATTIVVVLQLLLRAMLMLRRWNY
ncbi:MAG: hypothetical protein ACRD5R_16200 [Candidatus Acidiferrales bacterium]